VKRLASQLAAVQDYVLRESSRPVAGVVGTRAVSRGKRLGIYRDAYFLRLYEVLSSSYPGLKTLLGDRFDELIAVYTAQHRSNHFSIRYYGRGLSKLLSTDRRFKTEPALAEVAAWEWAMAHAFDAADAERIDMAALAAMPSELWAGVTFRFHSSIGALETRWNSVALWKAANRGETPPVPARNPGVDHWVVWRRALEVLFEKIDRPERDACGWIVDLVRPRSRR
jgi:hypothetical protein